MESNAPGATIALKDGRRLGYDQHGDLSGRPVFLFHGAPGSRVIRHPDESIARRRGLRIITVDRPGMGLSDFQPGRTLLDWPDDVAQLADALGIEQFAVIGLSGGGPHAAACAYKLPHRVTSAVLASCPVPADLPGVREALDKEHQMYLSLAKRPWLLRLALWWSVRSAPKDPAKALEQALAHEPPHDGAVLKAPGFFDVFWADTQACFAQGAKGCAHDMVLSMGPWGFPPEEITVPVFVWQGELDQGVPRAAGEYLARTIPACRAAFVPGEGHLGPFLHWEEILAAV